MENDEAQRAKHIIENLMDAFDIVALEVDFTKNRVVWTVEQSKWESSVKKIICEKVVDFHYAPDFTDNPPWTWHKGTVQKLKDEADFKKEEWFGFDKTKCPADWFTEQMPFYRFTVDAWGLKASTVCKRVYVEEPAETKN